MKKILKTFTFLFKDSPLEQSIEVESSKIKTLESLHNFIFENFKLKKDQYDIIGPPSESMLKIQKKFIVEIDIKKKCKDVIFIFPDEDEITIKNCSKMNFEKLMSTFKENGIYFSKKCIFDVLYFSLFGIELPFDDNYFTCVPRGIPVHFVMKGKVVILKCHDYKFILSDYESVKTALDLIQNAFKKCKKLSIKNILNENLEPEEKLRSKNNNNYKIVAKHKFTFASINNYKTKLFLDYLDTVEEAKQFISESVCSSEVEPNEIQIFDKDKDEVTDLDTKLINIIDENNQIFFKFAEDSNFKPKSNPSVRRKNNLDLSGSNSDKMAQEQDKKGDKQNKKIAKSIKQISDDDDDDEKPKSGSKGKPKVHIKVKSNEKKHDEEEESEEIDWEKQRLDTKALVKLQKEIKKANEKQNEKDADQMEMLNKKIDPEVFHEYMKKEEEGEEEEEEGESGNEWEKEKLSPTEIQNFMKGSKKEKKIKNIAKNIKKQIEAKKKIIKEDQRRQKVEENKLHTESDSEDGTPKKVKEKPKKVKEEKPKKADDDKDGKSLYSVRYDDITKKIEMKDDSSLLDNENNIKEKFDLEDDKIMLEYYICYPDGEVDNIEEPENVIMTNFKKYIIKVEAAEDKNGGDLESRISKTNASGEELLTVFYQIGGDDETLKKEIKSTDKVIDFKRLIQKDEGVKNIADIKILYAGKDLLDNIVLKSLNVGGDPLYVYIRQTDDLLLMTAKALRV